MKAPIAVLVLVLPICAAAQNTPQLLGTGYTGMPGAPWKVTAPL